MTTGNAYGGNPLRRGDNDKRLTWGGKKGSTQASHVEDLQKDLRTIGVYHARIDGDYGQKTEAAVRMFQWNAKNIANRVVNGQQVADGCKSAIITSGSIDSSTATELARWKSSSYVATGDLVRVPMSRLSTIELESGFKLISHSSVLPGEMVVSTKLLDDIKFMDEKAATLGLRIVVNQAFRVAGVPVSGAVVIPASRSQHLIGHALDCNIVDGDSWNTSADFKKGKETEKAKELIAALKDNGMRWGGDFNDTDTPHFDRQLVDQLSYDFKYLFNQGMLAGSQPIPLAAW